MSHHDWQEVVCGRQHWWVDPAWRDGLLGADGLRLPEWERQGLVEIVKQSVHRTVFRVGLVGRPIFVKYYPSNDNWSRLQQWLRPAKALREWARTLMLHRRSVPTITPLAAGTTTQGASYFVSAALEDTMGLYDYVQSHKSIWTVRERREVLRELGVFFARTHRSGVVHRDLHGGNVLVHEESGTRKWFLIDPYEAGATDDTWLRRTFTASKRLLRDDPLRLSDLRTSFALLGMAFWPNLSPADRLCFWRAFRFEVSALNCLNRHQERLFFQAVDREVRKRTWAAWSKRADRCSNTNREFYQIENQAWASRAVPESWLRTLLADPKAPWRDAATVVMKRSRHSQVGRIAGPDDRSCVYKAFQPRTMVEEWPWRESVALRCYRMAYRLELARVPTGKPLAVLQPSQRGGSSYLLLEYISNAEGLIEFTAMCRHSGRVKQLRAVTQQLAKYVRRLHDFGLSHRDLKVANLLVRGHGKGPPEPVFVDLRGVHHHRWLSRRRRAKDLARLALSAVTTLGASRSELLRFLCRYLEKERAAWRDWWRIITPYISRKVKRNHQRNRLVS